MLDFAWWAKNAGKMPAVQMLAGLAEFSRAWLGDVRHSQAELEGGTRFDGYHPQAELGGATRFDVGGGPYLAIELPVGVYEVSLVVNDGVEDSEADVCVVTVLRAGDLDMDGEVDLDDLEILLAGRNKVASGAGDPRDLDGDGMITVLDARILVTLFTR